MPRSNTSDKTNADRTKDQETDGEQSLLNKQEEKGFKKKGKPSEHRHLRISRKLDLSSQG